MIALRTAESVATRGLAFIPVENSISSSAGTFIGSLIATSTCLRPPLAPSTA